MALGSLFVLVLVIVIVLVLEILLFDREQGL